MQTRWLIERGADQLLLVMAGWGMDERPFQHMRSSCYDVLVWYDYRDATVPRGLDELMRSYQHTDLLAWSLGVPMALACLAPQAEAFRRSVAVNGTGAAVDAEMGIAPQIFQGTIENLAQGGLSRFRRRMCHGRELARWFESVAPERSLADVEEELRSLWDRLREGESPRPWFDWAIIGADDRVFPPRNQTRYWEHHGVRHDTIDAPHYPFRARATWEEWVVAPSD